MPQLPNPNEPGQPGIRGREVETDEEPDILDRTQPEAARVRADERPMTGRQPQHPGQPGRWHDRIGSRDEPANR